MGVQLRGIVQSSELKLGDIKGKKIAIDAFNTLHQFISIIRQRDGTLLMDSRGRTTSHLSGILYRVGKLLENNIEPIFVFDGKPPELKRKTIEMRRRSKRKAEVKLTEARRVGDFERIRTYAQATGKITTDMVANSKQLLDALGIAWVQAPGEGEAQAAYMCAKGDVYATGSQDFDSLLFGSKRLLRNLSITGKRKIPGKSIMIDVHPELIELDKVLSSSGISREQLVAVAILVGTDFNPNGVKGYGPKKALSLVKKEGTLEAVMDEVKWEFSAGPEEIADIFLKPDVTESYEVKRKNLNVESVRKLLCDEYDFDTGRVQGVIDRIQKSKGGKSQKSLEGFF